MEQIRQALGRRAAPLIRCPSVKVLMILIFITLIAMLAMARSPRRRRRWTANMQNVNTFSLLALLTTATSTLISADLLPPGDNEFRLLSIKGLWAIRDLTVGQGPIMIGVAHSDYSNVEIEEYLENEAQLTRGDMIATREIAKRLVRRIGHFSGGAAEETLNDGKPIKTRLNWPMAEGITLKIWAYNQSGAILATGAEVVFSGNLTIVWK